MLVIRLGRVDAPTLLHSFRSNTDEADLSIIVGLLRTSTLRFEVVLLVC